MAAFEDVPLTKDTWVDLHFTVGEAAATALLIQNVGGHKVRLQESILEPTDTPPIGTAVPPLSVFKSSPGASEKTWAMAINGNSTASVQVAP